VKGVRLPLAALVVLLAGAAWAQAPKPSPARPHLAVEPDAFDFGVVLQNKTLTKEFLLKNFGGADLVIEGVSTTCGCTAAIPGSRTLKPGAETTLRVTLETRTSKGPIERRVLIRSNDPAGHGLFDLILKATVQPAEGAAK
jgi:Protein of unknown function (DUF1573)